MTHLILSIVALVACFEMLTLASAAEPTGIHALKKEPNASSQDRVLGLENTEQK